MNWIINNWSLLVVIAAALGVVYFYVKKFAKLPTEEQIEKVKEWLLWAVLQAEAEFGGGTGQLKLHYVYDMFVQRFPAIAQAITFDMFSKLVDEVLIRMRKILETNLDITYALGIGMEETK